MRICFISSEYPPETAYGGIAVYTENLAKALARAGHEVDVVAVSPHREYSTLQEGVRVHRIMKGTGMGSWVPYRLRVLQAVNRLGPLDIVEAPEFNAEGIGVALFKKLFKNHRRFVTRLHTPSSVLGELYQGGAVGDMTSLGWKAVYRAEKVQIRNSDALHSPTRIAAREISRAMKIPVGRITVIPNGVDIAAFKNFIEVPHPTVPDDYLLYVGRLEPRKGVQVLAEALPLVFKEFPKLRFVFVGRDTAFHGMSMKKLIVDANKPDEGKLVFTGYVSEDYKKTLIKRARFVVLPSLSEGFGYSALEAMALGRAVIATSGTGFEEIVDGGSGFLVKPGDAPALAAQISYCLEHDMTATGINASARAAEFDMSALIGRYEEFYEGVLGDRA